MHSPEKEQPLILSVGGGKGGIGKSLVTANLAIQYVQAGKKVITIDLDIGGANLHTIFGIHKPAKNLGDYFGRPRAILEDYISNTSVTNLRLIPSSGFIPELAGLDHPQKVRLVNEIKKLQADLILLDLGAGTSSNVVDFFSMTNAGIVVTTAEPTSIVNAYEFLKNVVYRILFRMFRTQPQVLDIVKASTYPDNALNINTIGELVAAIEKVSEFSAQNIRDVWSELKFYLILNQARRQAEMRYAEKLMRMSKQFLDIDLIFGGMIFFSEEVSTSIHRMVPISLGLPDSPTSQNFKSIAQLILPQQETVLAPV